MRPARGFLHLDISNRVLDTQREMPNLVSRRFFCGISTDKQSISGTQF